MKQKTELFKHLFLFWWLYFLVFYFKVKIITKHLLSICYVSASVLDHGNTTANDTKTLPSCRLTSKAVSKLEKNQPMIS